MRCLVTGAAGFIGSTLVEALLEAGHHVVGVDGFIENYSQARKRRHLSEIGEHDRFRLIEGLLEDIEIIPLLDGVERIFHLAALPGVRSSWGVQFNGYARHNVLATQRLLEAAVDVGAGRLVYASSSSVYGSTDCLPMLEGAREQPYSPYGVTKLAAEHLVRLYHQNHALDAVTVRYFTIYGPRQRPDMAIQRFLRAARDETEITLFGDGEQSRDFTFVRDAVAATMAAGQLGQAGAIYNIGGGSRVTVNRLVSLIESITGHSLRVKREANQHGDVRHTSADCSRAREQLGFEPRTSLEDGLEAQWRWLRR